MKTPQTPVTSNQGSAGPDSPEPILLLPSSASHSPPTRSPPLSPTPSPSREQIAHQSGEGRERASRLRTMQPQTANGDSNWMLAPYLFLSQQTIQFSDLPGAIPMVNSLPATSGRACTGWTSEPAIREWTETSQPAAARPPGHQAPRPLNQKSVQPGCPEQQSLRPWKPLQQRDHRLVPAGPQLQLATQRRVADSAQSIAFALTGNIDGLKDLFSRGLASPRDVSDSRGFSLMRVCFPTPLSFK